jgi:hypothetical protein
MFFCYGGDAEATGAPLVDHAPQCPPGWTSRSVTLGHWEVGGATSGQWMVVAWYLPGLPFAEPLPMILQPWFPLLSYVQDRERATPSPSAPLGGPAVAAVVRQEGWVQDWGLFPASDLSAQVLVQCSTSPLGYGSRCLTGLELGGLWDVPILVLDLLPSHEADTLLRGLCWSALAKILFGGADFLLTASFRGGVGGYDTSKICTGAPSTSKFGTWPRLGGLHLGPRTF